MFSYASINVCLVDAPDCNATGGTNEKCRNRIFFQAICTPSETHWNDLLGKHTCGVRGATHSACCMIVERTSYTPVITDITFNPFCIVKNFPLFFLYYLNHTLPTLSSHLHTYTSTLFNFHSVWCKAIHGYYMDMVCSCSVFISSFWKRFC